MANKWMIHNDDNVKNEFIVLPGGELVLAIEHGAGDAEVRVFNQHTHNGAFASHGPDVKSCIGGLAAGFRALADDLDDLLKKLAVPSGT